MISTGENLCLVALYGPRAGSNVMSTLPHIFPEVGDVSLMGKKNRFHLFQHHVTEELTTCYSSFKFGYAIPYRLALVARFKEVAKV